VVPQIAEVEIELILDLIVDIARDANATWLG
jgi:hypothetical protein